ncbi:MAG: argininosuccinate lyase [Rickettsiales bacterium]|nr:argininosuccinate lyase [Rickettsiales bacterium]
MRSISGITQIAPRYEGFIIDLWGVMHDGTALYPQALEAFKALEATGKPVIFLSNAPRKAKKASAVLSRLGIGPTRYLGMLTSGQAAYDMLQASDDYGAQYYYLGPGKDEDVLEGSAYVAVDNPAEADFILNAGFEEDFQETKAIKPTLKKLLKEELPLLCINPDMEVVKQDGTHMLCAGWVAKEYAEMGGDVRYIGKPHPEVYQRCVQMMREKGANKLLCIGDNLATDILGANQAGMDSLLITGGVLHVTYNGFPSLNELQEACTQHGATPTYIAELFCKGEEIGMNQAAETLPEEEVKSDAEQAAANPMWGGHYADGPDAAFAAINPSIDFDKRLYAYDIAGSIAHSEMLKSKGILSSDECETIQDGLQKIRDEIEAGQFTFKPELEDIHMNVEARLKEIIGDVAGKLHTARSRNDQVAVDFRMYVRDALRDVNELMRTLQAALIDQAHVYYDSVMPGFTHLQSAQPVTMGHHLMAYVEMFARDRERLEDAFGRVNQSPLGAAALAGTSFDIDRHMTAELLGFDEPMRNSLDAVSDRDFVLEPLSIFAIVAMHLSRLSEELVIWTTPAFGFIELPENFTSGSSIMPQKRNPDAAELIRGKMGRIASQFQTLLMVMKSLPLAYNKDSQEDKEPFFEAYDQLRLCLMAMTGMIAAFRADHDRMREMAQAGFSTATDIADWLVRALGMPFRDAHHVTGRIVKLAEEKGCRLDELSLEQMQSVEPKISADIYDVLSVHASAASRKSFGGTSPERVKEAVEDARERYL